MSELIIPSDFQLQLAQVPLLFAQGKVEAVILRGTPGSDRFRVASAIAQTLNRHLIELSIDQPKDGKTEQDGQPASTPEKYKGPLPLLAYLINGVTLYQFDLNPGETETLPLPIDGGSIFQSPMIFMMGPEGGVQGTLTEKSITLNLPFPSLEQRLNIWRDSFQEHSCDYLDEIAKKFILPESYIRQTASMAIAQAGLAQHSGVEIEDVRRAARTLNRQLLDNLADRIEVNGSWEQLVTNENTLAKLLELEDRCLYREQIIDHLGPAFGNANNRGVRALLSGPSGTGKTLSARALAASLGMDLYRVDLASVVNKYIGETEKNLHQVLSRAEELDIILLLDEGDALLGQRTDVKSSNDRYANLETNYLLQRLENYQGIVLITTNAVQNIDTAFQRRMDVVVPFIPPRVEERRQIWDIHLPFNHEILK